MSLGAPEEFTSEEQAILASLNDDEPQATETKTEQPAPAETQTSEQPAPVQEMQNAEPAKPQGDVRAALRAARRAEQRARDEADRAKAELAELRSRVPQEPAPGDMSDAEIAEAERDFPLLAKTARYVKDHMAAPKPTTQPAQADEFTPPSLPPLVQEAVDSTPALLAWQHDPDQGRFALAVKTDALLQEHPHWRDKPMADRFQEVVRRVNAELPTAVQPARQDPREVLANVPRQTPETLTHIGGGGGRAPEAPALERYMKMSDDDIVADLLRDG